MRSEKLTWGKSGEKPVLCRNCEKKGLGLKAEG
jgi:hypothetical protein